MSETKLPKIVAHRGFSGRYPELTRRAFEEALKLPIHGVECDVRLTRDGRLVVFHDATVGRTTNGRGRVDAMDFADLRALNARLTREIAERERMQRELRVAEQTVQQASKLAALGEMSAGVSHELNQPLAAMKTYLAGARLLIERDRGDEALTSFQRIDDLLERMGTITRQLKSYARKGGEAFEPVDLRVALSGALTMMEPQLRHRRVRLQRSLPREPVMVPVSYTHLTLPTNREV